jgi:hypothetical protein
MTSEDIPLLLSLTLHPPLALPFGWGTFEAVLV